MLALYVRPGREQETLQEARLQWYSACQADSTLLCPLHPFPAPQVTLQACCPELVIQAFQLCAELWPFGGRAVSPGGLAPSSISEWLPWLPI